MITSKSWFICKISSILLYNSYVKVKIMGIRKLNGNENIYQHLCGVAVVRGVFVSTHRLESRQTEKHQFPEVRIRVAN